MNPRNHFNRYFSESTFNFFENISQQFLYDEMGSYVILHRKDFENSSVDDLYGEVSSSELVFRDPIQIPAKIQAEQSTNESYISKFNLQKEERGNLKIYILTSTLETLNVNIKFGDIIEYPMDGKRIFYEVSNTQNKTEASSNTFAGYATYWKLYVCTPTDGDYKQIL